MTCGVWIGYDEKKTLGSGETGARAALPVWMDFMKVALAGKDPGRFSGSAATDQGAAEGRYVRIPRPARMRRIKIIAFHSILQRT